MERQTPKRCYSEEQKGARAKNRYPFRFGVCFLSISTPKQGAVLGWTGQEGVCLNLFPGLCSKKETLPRMPMRPLPSVVLSFAPNNSFALCVRFRCAAAAVLREKHST